MRSSLVDAQLAAFEIGPVQLVFGFLRLFGAGKLDESEASAGNHIDVFDFTVAGEQVLQLLIRDGVIEIADVKLGALHHCLLKVN